MAVTATLRHWILGAALGCAALTVAMIPSPPDASDDPRLAIRPENGRSQIGRALGRMHRAALLISRRDEALQLVRGRTRPGQPLLLIDPRRSSPIGEVGRRHLQARLDSTVRAIGPLDTSVHVAVVVTRDTSYPSPGGLITFRGDWYALPEGTDGQTCLVMMALPRRGTSSLGPCAFYAAFGRPGPGILRWLQDMDYFPADDPDWTRPAFRESIDWQAEARAMNWWDIMQGSARFGLSLDASGCATGQLERCRTLVETPPWWAARRNKTETMRTILGRAAWRGDEMQGYLADLVRLMGRERFARFWRSPLPRDSAFVDAFGESIESWTHRWLSSWHPEARTGPGIRFSSVVLGMVLTGLLVAGGAFYTTRRQIA